jgi:Rad3-related DNA helicase
VAILDRRIAARGYGQIFLRSLPPAQILADNQQALAEHLDRFFAEHNERSSIRTIPIS